MTYNCRAARAPSPGSSPHAYFWAASRLTASLRQSSVALLAAFETSNGGLKRKVKVGSSIIIRNPVFPWVCLSLICCLIAGSGANGRKPSIDQHSLPPSSNNRHPIKPHSTYRRPLVSNLSSRQLISRNNCSWNSSNLATRWEGADDTEARYYYILFSTTHISLSFYSSYILGGVLHTARQGPFASSSRHQQILILSLLHKGPFPLPDLHFETSTGQVDSCQFHHHYSSFFLSARSLAV